MIAKTATDRVVFVIDPDVAAHTVGTAKFTGKVFVVTGNFEVFVDFVGSADTGGAGFIAGVKVGGREHRPGIQVAFFVMLVVFTGQHQMLDRLVIKEVGMFCNLLSFRVVTAEVIKEGKVKTYDMGGSNTTIEMANAIAAKI